MTVHPGQRPSASDRSAHYTAAASWAADVHGALRASRRTAWIVAGAATAAALLEAFALAALMPLKTVVPYTILVDRQTGYVETLEGLKPGALTQDAAVTQSFLVQYVIARETFDAADLSENYKKVMLWSSPDARNAYRQDMAKTNPQSPLVVNAPTTIVQTTIKSVSLLTPTTALVRFETSRRDAGSAPGDLHEYAAVLSFRYSGAPLRMEDRFINPLGFQVTSYRRDQETAPGAGAPVSGPVLGSYGGAGAAARGSDGLAIGPGGGAGQMAGQAMGQAGGQAPGQGTGSGSGAP